MGHPTVVVTGNPIVVVKKNREVIQVFTAGPQGPAGADGASGGIIVPYEHTQAVASALWTVNHLLGFRPVVDLYDNGGSKFEASVIHVSVNQLQVSLNSPLAGKARCV